jgi:hypothetical protein
MKNKMKNIFYTAVLFLIVLVPTSVVYCQSDTSKTKMSFDLGFTRGNNINLLPLYKRIKTNEKKEVDILFPFYGYKHDLINHSKRSHLFPVYWSDSTSTMRDFRFLSLYYPSFIHISTDRTNDSHSVKIIDLAPEINFLEFTKSANGQYVQNNAFFFLWYKNNKIEQKSHLIFFPLYWSFRNKENSSSTFIPFFSSGTTHKNNGRYLAITPLFWHFREDDKSRNILFPLWWNKKSGSGENIIRSNTLFPIYWSHKDQNENRKVLLPILWSNTNPQFHSLTVFPVFFNRVSTDKSWSRLMVTPIFWQIKNKEDRSDILFPIWFYNKSGSGLTATCSNTIFPIFWSYKGHGNEHTILIPFIWKFKNPLYSSTTIFPFYSKGISYDSTAAHLMITPFYWHFRDHENLTNVLFPLWWKKETGSGDTKKYSDVLFPFYWHYRDKLNDNEIIFPFIWSLKSPTYSSKTVLPFFSVGSSADSSRSHLAITPLFWKIKNGNVHRTILFPLYWSYEDNFKNNKVLFPLLWAMKDSTFSSVTFIPLFSCGNSTDHKSSYIRVTPLFSHIKNPDGYRNVLFPIWWNSKKGNGENAVTSNVIFPIYWSYKDNQRNNKILFPLVWSLKNTNYNSITIFPLFSAGHTPDGQLRHLMITPLFWHFKNPDGHKNILFPIWWNSRKGNGENTVKTNVIFPVYWSYKDNIKNRKILFPLLWIIKDTAYKTVSIAPLFSSGHSADHKTSYTMVTPLFWHFKNPDGYRNILFPIWWNSKKGNGENAVTSNVIFPIYWSYKNIERTNKILFPLVWSLKNKNYNSLTVFPIFSSGHTPDGQFRHLMVTPLFWHFKNPDGNKNILFPIWWYTKKGSDENTVTSNVIFPVYWSHKDKVSNNKIFFPLVWSFKNKNYSSFTIFPLLSAGHTPDGLFRHLMVTPLFWHFKNPDGHRNILFPIWWYSKKGNDENAVKTIVIFPIYWSQKDNVRNNKIFFPLVWSFKNKNYTSFTIFPLLSEGHTPDRQFGHLMITPIFWHSKKGDDYSNILFPIFWNSKTGSGENAVYSNVLFPIYFSYKQKNSDTKVLFPVIWYLKNTHYKSFTFVPLFSAGRSSDNSRNHLMVTPLFWHLRDGNETKNILFPIYWNSKQGSGDDAKISNILFPVFWSFKSKVANTKIVFPVIWKFKNSSYSSFTVFPLVSFGHSPDQVRSHFVFTPLFWSLHRPESRRVTLFPLFSYYSNKSGTSDFNILYFIFHSHKEPGIRVTDFLLPLCEYEKRANYTYFRFAPFIWYKKSPKDYYFSIQPFFYHSKDSVAESFNILWQLYSHKNIYNVKKSGNFLWKTIFRDKYANGDHEFRIFYFLYANMKKEGKVEHSLFPLYQSTKDSTGNKSLSVFFYFYNSFQRKIAGSKEFYREDDIFWFIRYRSNYQQLKAKGVDEKLIRQ